MTIELSDGLLKVTADKASQNWKPNEGVDPQAILSTVKSFLDSDGGNVGRALVALKSLSSVVNIPDAPEKGVYDPASEQHPQIAVDKQADPDSEIAGQEQPDAPKGEVEVTPTMTESVENPNSDDPGLNQNAVQAQDPLADVSQQPRGAAPSDIDSLEKPAQPSPTVAILANDVEMTLEEFDEACKKMNEAITGASSLDVKWEVTARGLEVTINGQLYIYQSNFEAVLPEWFLNRLNEIGKHNKGRAIAWLNKQVKDGEVTCTKISKEAEAPTKVWADDVKAALPAGAECNIMPQNDDWLCEFSANEIQGSISANLYAQDWFLQWTGKTAGSEKGSGLDSLVAKLKEVFNG